MKKENLIQLFKFLGFSLGAAVVQIVSFTLFELIPGITYWSAYIPSLILSVIFNFTFNRKYTFKAHNNIPLAMSLVILYYAVFTPLSTLWGNALENIGWNEYIILIGTMVINFVTEFLWQRFVVFPIEKKKKSAEDLPAPLQNDELNTQENENTL